MSDDLADLYSISQAAKFLQLHRATLYRLIRARKIRYYRVLSNRIRFSRAQLEEFLQRNERNGHQNERKAYRTAQV